MRKILFLTGTRADYGKMKPLMQRLESSLDFEVHIFICGMHLSEKFGSTYNEILKDGYQHTYIAYGLDRSQDLSMNLGNTITALSGYVQNIKPDMIVVHGDRMDALAGAVVGVINNIMVAHIEGGELSGTMDESIRHAISKFAHVHFVCSEEAKNRLIQLGEEKTRIYVIGSPDIDVMLSEGLPSLEAVKQRYNIHFERYGILMYHPVTTEYNIVGENIRALVDAIIESKKNYIVVYPNNDLGSEIILNEYKRFEGKSNFSVYPSIRFECFLTLLKHAEFMIGNSSAGIRETGVYGISAIDVGTRQAGRYSEETSKNIKHVCENKAEILEALFNLKKMDSPDFLFGDGNSTDKFIKIVNQPSFWEVKLQKKFVDFDN